MNLEILLLRNRYASGRLTVLGANFVPKVAILSLLLSGLPCPLFAGTNWYVRSDAGGLKNGTDWNNAWPEFTNIVWTSVNAGDTVWVAAGLYRSQLKPSKSGSSGSVVSI